MDWSSISYKPGRFVITALNSNLVATSLNGVTWTTATMPTYGQWVSVTYNSLLNKFLAVDGLYSENAAYSNDGALWVPINTTASNSYNFTSVSNNSIDGGNYFIALGTGGINTNKIYISDSGTYLNQYTIPYSYQWSSIDYGLGKWVGLSKGPSNKSLLIM